MDKLPENFSWIHYDKTNMDHLSEISEFLNNYYVQDTDFRLQYSKEFLQMYFYSYKSELIGITFKGILCGFISSIATKNKLFNDEKIMAEINFLCIIPYLRNLGFASILINKLKRILFLSSIFSAIYTSAYSDKPAIMAQYYHYPLNYDKLIETGFMDSHMTDNLKDNDMHLIKLENKYISETFDLFNNYIKKYDCYPILSLDEFTHMFFNNNFIESYIVINNNKVTDFVSYTKTQSKILNCQKYEFLNVYYLCYYATNNLEKMIESLLISIKKEGIADVFNILDIMDNKSVISNMNFLKGTGILLYTISDNVKLNNICKLFF